MRSSAMLALRGAIAVLFGLWAVFWPRLTVYALALLFGAFALVNSAFVLIDLARRGDGTRQQRLRRRAPQVIAALLGVAAGLATLIWPQISVLVLVTLIGAWAVITGVGDIWAAAQQRGHWLIAVTGAVTVAAGVLVLVLPTLGALAIAQVIGVYALVVGVLMLIDAARVRRAGTSGGAAPAGAR
ncbi:HdeD family acid-resistance protein [Micromonospora pattaloongensis]|uniref:HdeD family acid-resistance protein n=1 Tax=Micromonospora pattaloongensis TaxID=405436 RepID=UPI001C312A3F|nr:DUF308 domain-containing protein [Micromonospora pattaloongensis]